MAKSKLVSILLCVALLLTALCAVAGAEEQIVVAYSNCTLMDSWRAANLSDMETWAAEYGFKLISTCANEDSSKQLSDIDSLLAQNPAVLVVSPWESAALAQSVEKCNQANVPLIVIDRSIDATPGEGMFKTYIAQNHVDSGRYQAERAVELLTAKYGEPKGNVIHIAGTLGAGAVTDALKGWNEVMANYPNIKIIDTGAAEYSKELAISCMEDFLQKYDVGEIDLIRSDYSEMTEGIIGVIEREGRNELLGMIVGNGGQINCLKYVAEGKIGREVQTTPYFGEMVMQTVTKLVAGETVEPVQEINVKIFDSDDVAYAEQYIAEITEKGLDF